MKRLTDILNISKLMKTGVFINTLLFSLFLLKMLKAGTMSRPLVFFGVQKYPRKIPVNNTWNFKYFCSFARLCGMIRLKHFSLPPISEGSSCLLSTDEGNENLHEKSLPVYQKRKKLDHVRLGQLGVRHQHDGSHLPHLFRQCLRSSWGR